MSVGTDAAAGGLQYPGGMMSVGTDAAAGGLQCPGGMMSNGVATAVGGLQCSGGMIPDGHSTTPELSALQRVTYEHTFNVIPMVDDHMLITRRSKLKSVSIFIAEETRPPEYSLDTRNRSIISEICNIKVQQLPTVHATVRLHLPLMMRQEK